MSYEKYRVYVEKKLKRRELLEHTSEKAYELAQAALNFVDAAKAKMSNDPIPSIPLTLEETQYYLHERVDDMLNCLYLLGHDVPIKDSSKWKQWAILLGYKEAEKAD